MKKWMPTALAAAALLYAGSIPALPLDAPPAALRDRAVERDVAALELDWQYRGMKTLAADPAIKHYMWEARVGDGPYDFIRAHRYIRQPNNEWGVPGLRAKDPRKVMFVINGTWAQEGEEPPELYDAVFFPSHGYDLWGFDFRTSFLPTWSYEDFQEKDPDGLYSTTAWTYAAFREDAKHALELAKAISGAEQVFLGGRSRGGTQAYMYVAKYPEDVKALIGLDGGPIYRRDDDPSQQLNEAQAEAYMASFKAGELGPLLSEIPRWEDGKLQGEIRAVDELVGEPLPAGLIDPQGNPVEDVTDWLAYLSWGGNGITTNYYVHQDKEVYRKARGDNTRYWPAVQDVEGRLLAGWSDNPYLDYDDTQNVDIPVFYAASQAGCYNGDCLSDTSPLSIPTDDFRLLFLPTYGHLDIYYGVDSNQDVKMPLLDWMNARL